MGLISEFKELAGLVKKAGDMDLYRRIVDFQGEIVELGSRNFELEKENRDLREAAALAVVMDYGAQQFYYKRGENPPVAYCPNCYDGERKAIHLYQVNTMRWDCHRCKAVYGFM